MTPHDALAYLNKRILYWTRERETLYGQLDARDMLAPPSERALSLRKDIEEISGILARLERERSGLS